MYYYVSMNEIYTLFENCYKIVYIFFKCFGFDDDKGNKNQVW